MTWSEFASLLKAVVAAIPKAVADFKANKPLAATPAQTLSSAQVVAGVKKLQTLLDKAIPILQAHPGAITAADDILDVLDKGGFSWAVDAEDAVNAAPTVAVTVRGWLPEAIWLLGITQPAATGIQGDAPPDANFRVGRE